MVKPIGYIVGMLVIGGLFFLGVIAAEDQLMDTWVSTGPNITLDEWRQVFVHFAQLGVFIALGAALVWFGLGQWKARFGMNRWSNANKKRIIWSVCLVFAALGAVPGLILTPAVQEWGRLAWACYVANGLALFYLATLLFSPSSFKYVPWLAMRVRHW